MMCDLECSLRPYVAAMVIIIKVVRWTFVDTTHIKAKRGTDAASRDARAPLNLEYIRQQKTHPLRVSGEAGIGYHIA